VTELLPEDHQDPGWMIDQELADTLEDARAKGRRNYRLRLQRIRDAAPPAPRLPGCGFCGARTLPGRDVCHAHSDIA
jgi:hypothetical protein